MRKYKNYKVLLIIILCFFFFTNCDQFKEDYNKPEYNNPLRIGIVGDVSASREQVENIFLGVKLAAEEINACEGVLVNDEIFDIELVYKNSAGSPDEGISVTNQLIKQGVDIIVGPSFSSVAIEMAEYCIDSDVLMMTYSATTPELSFLDDKNLIWRTCPSDYTFGTISAQYCFNSLHMRKAAILYRDDRFGQGLSEVIKNRFLELGGEVLSNVPFPVDDVNLSTCNITNELNTVFGEEVDVVYIIAFNSDLLHLANEIYNNTLYQSLEKKPVLFLNDGIIPIDIINNVNSELFETIVGITSTNSNNPNYIKFYTNFTERFGFSPTTYSEHAYDALYCLVYAMLNADSPISTDVVEHLWEVSGSDFQCRTDHPEQIIINVDEYSIAKELIKRGNSINYEGASGPINFDYNGDPSPIVTIWGIENNEYIEIGYYDR